jgi:hypothetical protein
MVFDVPSCYGLRYIELELCVTGILEPKPVVVVVVLKETTKVEKGK